MIKQAICVDGFINHILCPIWCHLNGVQINEVSKFLAVTSSETTHVIELVNSFDTIGLLIILLKLSGVTSYFDVYSPSIAEYEDEEFSKFHLTAEEPPWDPSTKTQIQISIMLIGMVRKRSIDLKVLSKRWGIIPQNSQKTIQATTQRGIRSMLHLSLSR